MDQQKDGENRAAGTECTSRTPLLLSDDPDVKAWLEKMPLHHAELGDVSTKLVLSASHLQGWIMSIYTAAVTQLSFLDKQEIKYREIGLQYHTIRYDFRSVRSEMDYAPIIQELLARLNIIFQINSPRCYQMFFLPWEDAAIEVDFLLDGIRNSRYVWDIKVLERIFEEGFRQLDRIYTAIADVQRGVSELQDMFDQFRASLRHLNEDDVKADLTRRFSREGRLLSTQIGTFSEVFK